MRRQQSVLITVLSTQINHKKVYVEGLSRRSWDNRLLITSHTEDPEHAREFLNETHAEETKLRLVNHHGREYNIECIMVPVSKRHSLMDNDELT